MTVEFKSKRESERKALLNFEAVYCAHDIRRAIVVKTVYCANDIRRPIVVNVGRSFNLFLCIYSF